MYAWRFKLQSTGLSRSANPCLAPGAGGVPHRADPALLNISPSPRPPRLLYTHPLIRTPRTPECEARDGRSKWRPPTGPAARTTPMPTWRDPALTATMGRTTGKTARRTARVIRATARRDRTDSAMRNKARVSLHPPPARRTAPPWLPKPTPATSPCIASAMPGPPRPAHMEDARRDWIVVNAVQLPR